MQYEEFIDRVRQRAGLASAAEAEGAARAVLTVLGEYLSGGEGLDLTSQLPQGLAEILRQQPPDRSKIFSLNDFVQMVGEEEEVDDGAALAHTRAVFGVLQEAVSGGEMEDALDHGGAHVAFRGHAHNGSFTGETPSGVPVFNVSVPVLKSEGFEQPYFVFEI